jgi:hypothetical protein
MSLAPLTAAASTARHALVLFSAMHFACGVCIETAGFGLHRSAFCWTTGAHMRCGAML